MACKEKVLSLFNEHLTFKSWQPSDIHRAHRLGKQRHNADRPRPLIVKLMVTDDKVRALKARPVLKANGYGIASDLTTRQRQQLQALKGTNQFGFFKDGKLITKTRSETPPSFADETSVKSTQKRRSIVTSSTDTEPSTPVI